MEQFGFTMHSEHIKAYEMANSVDPDQTAPIEVLFWYAPTALTYLSRYSELLQYLAKTDREGNSTQTTRCLQHLKSLS